jgi:class 3 adenylate cyclase
MPPSDIAPTAGIDRSVLSSYVPAVVQRLVADLDGPIEEPRLEPIPGALLFADVSGFTALTERLAAAGAAGTETLTRVLNDYFGGLIARIAHHRGDVLKFAGDALVVSFPEEDGGAADAVLRAGACALDIQSALAGHRSDEGIPLSLKLAVSSGRVACAYLGGVWGRWEMIVVGPPLSAAGQAADHCEPGAVVLSPEAWRLAEDQCTGVPIGDGAVRLERVDHPPAPPPQQSVELSETAARAAWTFLPGAIRARLQAGQGHWLAELRRITVIFARLPGHAGDVSLEKSQQLMTRLQRLVYSVEGSVNKISADDKGLSFVAVLGMPPLAHEDDPRRSVRLALAMASAMTDSGFAPWIGVATGRAFCGVVSSELRCEYTMLGDVVNLAARLMVASNGGVLCDAATRDGAAEYTASNPSRLWRSRVRPSRCRRSSRAARRTGRWGRPAGTPDPSSAGKRSSPPSPIASMS